MAHDLPTDEEIAAARQLADGEPDETRHRVRLAELYRRLDDREHAATAYRRAGRAFAVQGDWLRAFAVARALQHIDPEDTETQRFVSALYVKRSPEGSGGRQDGVEGTSLSSSVLDGPVPPPLATSDRFPLETTRITEVMRVPLLGDLTPADLGLISHHLRTVVVPRGGLIFREGEVSEGMFLVLRGEAQVTVVDDTGSSTHLSSVGPGEVFGEFSLIGPPLRTAQVEASTRTELLDIDRELYELLTERSEIFRRALSVSIRRRQRENVLARSSLLASLEPAVRAVLAGQMDTISVMAGELVARQGEPADRIHVLGSGRLEIYERDETGEKSYVTDLLPGQFVPDPAVIDGDRATVNARATEPSQVFWLGRQVLLDHVGDTPERRRELRRVFTEPPLHSGAFAAVHSQPLPDASDDRK